MPDSGIFIRDLLSSADRARTVLRTAIVAPGLQPTISCRANRRRCCAPFPALCNMLVLGHMVTWLLEIPPFHPFRGLQDHWLLACLELRELKASLADH